MKENIVIKYPPYGTFLSLGNAYPMDILVCCKLCKSSCSLFGKHMGSAIVGIGWTFLPNGSDHYFGFSASGTAERLSWEIPKLVF